MRGTIYGWFCWGVNMVRFYEPVSSKVGGGYCRSGLLQLGRLVVDTFSHYQKEAIWGILIWGGTSQEILAIVGYSSM